MGWTYEELMAIHPDIYEVLDAEMKNLVKFRH